MWHIVPNVSESNVTTLGNITQVMATDEVSEGGMPQIVYVAYQDPEQSNETTLHFGKERSLIYIHAWI